MLTPSQLSQLRSDLDALVDACLGRTPYVGADADVGLRTVQAIDAMYRSSISGNVEACL